MVKNEVPVANRFSSIEPFLSVGNTNPLYITRFFAAVGVVLYHYKPEMSDNWFRKIIGNMDEGVNYFYFLSGFVMVVAYQNEIAKISGVNKAFFWIKRLARIYPLYLAALFLCLFFHFAVQSRFTSIYKRLPFESLMVQSWFALGSINFPAWSVSCEVFFYLLFPFLAVLVRHLSKEKLIMIFLSCMIIDIGLQIIGGNVDFIQTSGRLQLLMETHPFFRVGVFICGMITALLFMRMNFLRQDQFITLTLLFSILFIIGACLYLFPQKSLWIRGGAILPFYGILVVLLCSLQGRLGQWMSNPLFVMLGDASYGIYLLQSPIHLFFAHYFGGTTHIGGFIEYAMILVVVSVLSYYFFEKPVRNYVAARIRNLKSVVQEI